MYVSQRARPQFFSMKTLRIGVRNYGNVFERDSAWSLAIPWRGSKLPQVKAQAS
jgi:hypothetical protein